MTANLFQKRKSLFWGVLFVAFFTFALDILDLREELYILTAPYNGVDSDVSAGLTSDDTSRPGPILTVTSAIRKASVIISFIHLLPFGFRAPPTNR